MKCILTIAGSDCSGGAGIQADIKTITAHKMYAMSVITALTAQNTVGVFGVQNTSPEFTTKQIDAIFNDIPPNAIKIGMVSTSENINAIAERLTFYKPENIVIDPVMISTSGKKLLEDNALNSLEENLLPLATLITPNIPEAEFLSKIEIKNQADIEFSARIIYKKLGVPVLVKGGHGENKADDTLFDGKEIKLIKGELVENDNTHGTGCTLSSAIACELAKGLTIEDSIKNAKQYLQGALKSGLNLGKSNGPLDHCFKIEG